VREKLIAALTSAVNDPEVVANFTNGGGEPRSLSGDAFAARVKRELEEMRELNKVLKITID
jgi:tripartite-type tricarboxylate transporter receptor subunit TctC